MVLHFLVLLIFFGIFFHSVSTENSRPVIAILTQPPEKPLRQYGGSMVISGEYVKWLESGGARILILPHSGNMTLIDHLLSQSSGILFQGGETNLIDHESSPYLQISNKILDYARSYNVPVFATCLGFEQLMVYASNNPKIILDTFDAENITLPLVWTKDATKSKLLAKIPNDILNNLASKPLTVNLHHNGITTTQFQNTKQITDMFHMLAINQDLNKKPFVSIVEAWNHPIYGVQFHPERNAYLWNDNLYINNHSYEAIHAMAYFSEFFVQQTREFNIGGKYPTCCDSISEKYLVQYHAPIFVEKEYMKQIYILKNSDFE